MIYKNIVSLFVCLFVSLQSFSLQADATGFRGKVLKFNGDVEVVNARGETRVIKNVDEPLNEMDTIVTRPGARVVVQYNDGALSVLDEKSRLRVEKTSWFSYLGGKVYFTFKKVFGEPRHIKTRAATIGVRGTTFVIAENADRHGESVALKEGLLEIISTGPAFEIHKQRMLNEFEQFKHEQQQAKQAVNNEFKQYRQQMNREFVEYRRQFMMQPDRVISFSGFRVDEAAMTEQNRADFASFEAEAEEMIRAFRE